MSRSLPDSMHWQIYQAYRQPSALFRLFEDVFGRLALCGSPDPDQQQLSIESLSDEIGQLKAQIEKLQAEVTELHADNFRLARRNCELEALVTKDSHNSSRPPSTVHPGRSGHGACAAHLVEEQAGKEGIADKRFDCRRAPTAKGLNRAPQMEDSYGLR
jgi:regulator of replication initiation timing